LKTFIKRKGIRCLTMVLVILFASVGYSQNKKSRLHDHTPDHGGKVAHGLIHMELIEHKDELRLFISDQWREKISTKSYTGTLTINAEGRNRRILRLKASENGEFLFTGKPKSQRLGVVKIKIVKDGKTSQAVIHFDHDDGAHKKKHKRHQH